MKKLAHRAKSQEMCMMFTVNPFAGIWLIFWSRLYSSSGAKILLFLWPATCSFYCFCPHFTSRIGKQYVPNMARRVKEQVKQVKTIVCLVKLQIVENTFTSKSEWTSKIIFALCYYDQRTQKPKKEPIHLVKSGLNLSKFRFRKLFFTFLLYYRMLTFSFIYKLKTQPETLSKAKKL